MGKQYERKTFLRKLLSSQKSEFLNGEGKHNRQLEVGNKFWTDIWAER